MAVFFSRFPRRQATAGDAGHEVLDATEARQGRWGRHVFWVLVASTLLAVAALFGSWAFHSDELAAAPDQDRVAYADAQTSGGHSSSPKQRDTEDPAPTPR